MTKRKSKPQPKTFNPHHQELVSLFHHPGINVFPTPNIGLALAHLPCCETAGVKLDMLPALKDGDSLYRRSMSRTEKDI